MTLFTKQHTALSKRIYEGNVLNLRVDELQAEDGNKTTREVVEHNGGVVILCQPQPYEIVLVKQYRYSLDCELIELPAGRVELGELPLACAQRELAEETGYLAENWKELCKMYSAPGFCNELLHMYCATDVRKVERQLDEDEEIDVLVLPMIRAWHLVLTGEIRDAKTIAGLGMLMNASS